MSKDNKEIKGLECKFAIHIPSKSPDIPDMHLVKERVHYTDGTTAPRTKMIKDYKRSFWITKPSKRSFTQKKEGMPSEDLLEKRVTQSQLRDAIARALDKPYSREPLKQLGNSPYLFGSDISSTSLIKKDYQNRFPECNSEYSVAQSDVETDVVNGTNDIIMISVVYEDRSFTAVLKSFVQGLAMVEQRFQEACQRYIGEYLTKYNISPQLYLADDPIDLLRSAFNKLHEWQPDFLEIWNINYDITKILEMFTKYQVDPKEVLCDPSVPMEFRKCKYIMGKQKKVTASGQVKPINPAAQWHTLDLTASFYVIDGMCSYKYIRLMSEQEEPSYALDAILKKHLGIRKLKFKEAEQYEDLPLEWHKFMQTYYPIEYMVYNLFDSLSMMELDKQTKDLSIALPYSAEVSDFSKFDKQSKRMADALHFFFLEKGEVISSTGFSERKKPEDVDDEMKGEEEEEMVVLDRRGWVITLPAHMSILGLPLIQEDPVMRTGIRKFVFDIDAVSAYPTGIEVANLSKATTKRELISIEGIEEKDFRMQNLNVVLGQTNALEYTVKMFNAPKPYELLAMFQEESWD